MHGCVCRYPSSVYGLDEEFKKRDVAFRAAEEEGAVKSVTPVPVPVNYRPHRLISVILFPRGSQDHNWFQSKPHQSASDITPEPLSPPLSV